MTDRTISYDVFDTVVTRSFAHPRDIFVYLGLLLRERDPGGLDAMEFARARWAAELTARKLSSWTEVLLDDIYRELATRLGWDATTALMAKKLELEVESRHLRGVPLMRPVLDSKRDEAGRLVFLSDMYLPAAVLRPWLEREGVIKPGDLLLISGEARGNKSSGALFTTALNETGGSFARWHHTGDHPFADVEKPRQLGIMAAHFGQAHLTRRERLARGTTGEFAPVAPSLLAGAMRLARLEHSLADDREAVLWETGTAVAGPLFYGFVCWTLAEAERRGLQRLYFLARDGQIFWRLARAIQQAGSGRVECIYLQASRLVFAGPAELDAPEALRLLAAPTAQFHSLRQTLVQFGLDDTWARCELPAEFTALDADSNLPQTTRERLADWLLAPARRAILRAAIERRAVQARAYLDSVGLRAGEPVGLVDTGWLGSIQRNLERILGQDGAPAALPGFYLGLLPPAQPATAGPRLGYTNTFDPLPLMREESHKVLIELMAQSDQGQVTGFRKQAGRWEPELNPPGPVNLEEIRLFQEAVLAFTRRMLDTAGTAAWPTEALARTVIGLYRDFHDHPAAREARVFGFLPHADQLFEQRHAPLCAEPGLRGTATMLWDFRRRPPHWWVGGQAALGQSLPLRVFRALKALLWRLLKRPE